VTYGDDPCIGGTDLVVVARFRAAAVLRLNCSPGPPPAVATDSAATGIAMRLQIRYQPAAIPNPAEPGHNPASVDFRY
jgi:hypothetical protein